MHCIQYLEQLLNIHQVIFHILQLQQELKIMWYYCVLEESITKFSLNGPILLLRSSWIGFLDRVQTRFQGFWSCTSTFSSKMIRHILYMIKTYIIKIQSRNHDNRLLAVPKISLQLIPKTKILNRIIQSKMIPVQVQICLTWTGIGIVCRNIGPIFTKSTVWSNWKQNTYINPLGSEHQ